MWASCRKTGLTVNVTCLTAGSSWIISLRKKKKMKTRKSSMTMPSVMRICFYTHFPWQWLTAWMERRKRYWSVLNRQSVSCFRQREMSFSVIVYSGKREWSCLRKWGAVSAARWNAQRFCSMRRLIPRRHGCFPWISWRKLIWESIRKRVPCGRKKLKPWSNRKAFYRIMQRPGDRWSLFPHGRNWLMWTEAT